MISESRFIQIWELCSGAEQANQHCVWNTNELNAFCQGLQAAMDIINAESDEHAKIVAAKLRENWANRTGTTQEHWRVGDLVPQDDWIVK